MTRLLSLPLLILTKGMKVAVLLGLLPRGARAAGSARRALCPGATTPIAAA